MFNGHRGINNPVINHETGKGEITSQNHGFAVDRKVLESNPNIIITHSHLNDNTVAGLKMKSKNCFSVQYHPEGSRVLMMHIIFLQTLKKCYLINYLRWEKLKIL